MERILLLILVIACGNNTATVSLNKQFLKAIKEIMHDNRLFLTGSKLNRMTVTFRTA